ARTPAPHRLAASLPCGCIRREGAVLPITKTALSLLEISDHWSRENPPVSSNDVLRTLVSAWWFGELRGYSIHSRLQLLKLMFTSFYRDDLEINFIVGDGTHAPEVELSDPSLQVVLREIRVPSADPETWDEAGCRDAFQALAEITDRSS